MGWRYTQTDLRIEAADRSALTDSIGPVQGAERKIVVAPAEADLDGIGDADLILNVESECLLSIETVRLRTRHRQRETTVNRIQDIDDICRLVTRISADDGWTEAQK